MTIAAPAAPARATPPGPATPPWWRGWLGPVLAAVVGGVLRLWELGRPDSFVFDETYYAKDALGLLRFGTEQDFVEGADQLILDSDGDWRALDVFTGDPSFVVHPPFGKWLIAAGEATLGMTPTGWRIVVALLGVAAVVLLGRIVRRLTRSDLLGTIAAGLLALDGIAIVMSRTAVLDGLLMFFVLAAFGALLIDRDRTANRYCTASDPGWTWWRPWRLAAGLLLGLAISIKWSGLWYLVAFGLLTVFWEWRSRRRAGVLDAWRSTVLQDAVPAFLSLVGVAAVAYLATWTGWLATDTGWGRDAAAPEGSLLPQPLAALWEYHRQMYGFHVGLSSEHSYQSPAWGWLLQARPTSFFYEGDLVGCGQEPCSAAVNAVGNPVIWWAGTLALLHQAYRAVFVRDWRAGAVVVAFLAGWAPWLLYPDRTIFAFYSVVFVPYVVAALTLSLGQLLGDGRDRHHKTRVAAVGAFLVLVVLAAWWFAPIWLGAEIPTDDWRQRMWLPTWI